LRTRTSRRRRERRFGAPGLALALLAGCGGGGSPAVELPRGVEPATRPARVVFPAAQGRTLRQVADALDAVGPEVAPATTVHVAGRRNRLAFGVIDPKGRFVYGPTAVYVARTPESRASGPFSAPADVLRTAAPFRSRQAATEEDAFAAVYAAQVALPRAGRYVVLSVTSVAGRLIGATTQISVRPEDRDPVASVGDRAPRVATDTLASVHGDKELLDTRVPPGRMQQHSLTEVLGHKPVALIFATPQLCQSRVCGPVVDIAAQLKAKYGDEVEFIHQEVYRDNDPRKGLREPLRRFGLPTEPWLFVIDRHGRIRARLEGSFGLHAFEAALKRVL